jgi:hypothetical protein
MLKKLSNIPHDKALHLAYGLIIYSFIALYNHHLAVSVVILVAVAKELYDSRFDGTVESKDIAYTVTVPIIISTIKDVL